MKLEQYIGPFSKSNQIIFNKSNVKYLQLGIEYPYSIPLSETDFDQPSALIRINSKEFILTLHDILEFKNLNLTNVIIEVENKINDSYLIINIAYEEIV